jgi:hypothetical protein
MTATKVGPAWEDCGTYHAWTRHKHHKVPIDDACRKAQRVYMRGYRVRKGLVTSLRVDVGLVQQAVAALPISPGTPGARLRERLHQSPRQERRIRAGAAKVVPVDVALVREVVAVLPAGSEVRQRLAAYLGGQ